MISKFRLSIIRYRLCFTVQAVTNLSNKTNCYYNWIINPEHCTFTTLEGKIEIRKPPRNTWQIREAWLTIRTGLIFRIADSHENQISNGEIRSQDPFTYFHTTEYNISDPTIIIIQTSIQKPNRSRYQFSIQESREIPISQTRLSTSKLGHRTLSTFTGFEISDLESVHRLPSGSEEPEWWLRPDWSSGWSHSHKNQVVNGEIGPRSRCGFAPAFHSGVRT